MSSTEDLVEKNTDKLTAEMASTELLVEDLNDTSKELPPHLQNIPYPQGKNLNEKASFLSYITVTWFDQVLRKGWKKPLEMEDLAQLGDRLKSHSAANTFISLWNAEESQGRKPSILRILFSMNKSFAFVGLWKILGDVAIACTALVMQGLVGSIIKSQTPEGEGSKIAFLYAALFLILTMTSSFIVVNVMQKSISVGVAVKGLLSSVIYRKCLKLSGAGRAKFSSGKILNLISTDLGRIEMACNQIHLIWTSPLWFIVTFALVIYIIGPSGLAGIAIMLFSIPVQGYMIRKLMALRKTTATIADERIKLTSEALTGIRVIKFFTWESSFSSRINGLRECELEKVKTAAYIRSTIQSFGFALPAIASAVTFLVYGATSTNLSPVTIFSTLALFNQLRQPVMWVPVMVATLGDAVIGFGRIEELLRAPENELYAELNKDAEYGVEVKDGEFVWETIGEGEGGQEQTEPKSVKDSDSVKKESDYIKSGHVAEEVTLCSPQLSTLRHINLTAPKNGLTAIVGAVGSGKSSLLSSLTAELKRIKGTVTFSGSVGYCPQQPWIINASLRDNILFGNEFNEKRYKAVLKAACLVPDLKVLPNGDASEIGERGISISGGQKARISFARMMYLNRDIALLDDPLSAVDANVGRKMFEEGICGPLLAGKTRLLVTHQLHYVSRCDWIVVMRDGEIAEQGTFEKLMADQQEFYRLMMAYGGESGSHGPEDETAPESTDVDVKLRSEKVDTRASEDFETTAALNSHKSSKIDLHQQTQKETKETGSIKSGVLIEYFKNYGSAIFVSTIFVALLLTQATRLANDLWLIFWIQTSFKDLSKDAYMGIYAGLGLSQAMALLFYATLFAIGGIHAAKALHGKVFGSVMGSAVSFFDQTPLGRIVNRLSRDIDYADNSIYDAIRLLFYSLLQLVAAFGLVAYFTKGIFLAILAPMLGIYYFCQLVYRTSSRELKRVESVSRSPLYAHISESISGLSTIRAYGEQTRFTERAERLIDSNGTPLFLLYSGQRWIQLRLEMIGNILVFFVAIFAAADRFSVNPSQIGLALSYLLQTTSLLNMAIFQAVEAEVQLNAVERLVEYVKLPSEEEDRPDFIVPPTEWPSKGEIRFENVKMRYQPNLPLVLNGINVTFKAGEKIAEGSIYIDDIDTGKMALKDLRSRLAIIPQDPVLFTGSLRSNLDPHGKFTDATIWDVLQRCGMKDAVSELEGKLDAKLVENGDNISVGQRQLLCLARACLQRPRIIVLDECTASVDLETDMFIQRTIKEEFSDATTLTIAHRLNTIVDSDKVLVLSQGNVKEFDTPYNLLITNPDSEFARLVAETGEANASMLRSMVSNYW
ncbi:hypothetical protein HDV05_008443 [Chytridiales sp. JEL 0842]|nr:hypothetical protein HDV05_008443 [Chytridiales sp. JEL 0842]